MSNLNFNANNVAPMDDYSPLPAGEYPAILEKTEFKPYENNPGKRLALTFQVIDGPYKGRKIFDSMNLEHPNQQTVEIAQRALSSLCRAVRQMNITDSAQLHNIPLIVKVKIVAASGKYNEQNKVVAYKEIGKAPALVPDPSAMSPSAGKNPWA